MTKNIKFLLWCVMVAVTSFWMWVNVDIWLEGPLFETRDINNLFFLGGLFVILLTLLALGFVIFRKGLWSIYLGLIVGIIYAMIFGVNNLTLVGIFITVMLFYHAQDIVIGEMNERIKMNSRLLIKKGLMNFIAAFFILVSFAAYQSPAVESLKNTQQLPSSTEKFIKTIVEQTLSNQLKDSSSQEKDFVLNQVTEEVMRESNLFLQPYFKYIPPALAFGLFLVLWGVGWFFLWLSVFLGIIVFHGLKKTNFFRIEEKDAKIQVLHV